MLFLHFGQTQLTRQSCVCCVLGLQGGSCVCSGGEVCVAMCKVVERLDHGDVNLRLPT